MYPARLALGPVPRLDTHSQVRVAVRAPRAKQWAAATAWLLSAALLSPGLLAAAEAEPLDRATAASSYGLSAGSRSALHAHSLGASPLSSMWQRQADRVHHLQLGQARFDLSVGDFDLLHQRARLFGDYYLTGPGFGDGQVDGGLRLTSGLAFGRVSSGLSPAGARDGPVLGRGDLQAQAQPYLGLGYSRLSARAGWAFSADIGLGRWATQDGPRLGRGGPSDSQVERLLDDLRLSPVIQLGVRYAF